MSHNLSSIRKSSRLAHQATTPRKEASTMESHKKNKETEFPLSKSFLDFTEKIAKFSESLSDLRCQYEKLTNDVEEWKNRIAVDVRRVEDQIRSIITDQSKVITEIDQLKRSRDDTKSNISDLKHELHQSKENCAALQESLATLTSEHDEQKKITAKLQKDLERFKTESLIERQSDKTSLAQLREDIRKLREEKSNEVESLKTRLGKIDADKTSNNLILSGRHIPAVAQNEDPVAVAISVLRTHLQYELRQQQVETAYRIGRLPESGSPDKRKIILKLSDKNIKRDLFGAYKTMKVQDLYINEELTPEVNHLYYQLRQLKKMNPSSFDRLFTRDGIIKARKSPTGKMYSIVTQEQLDIFKRDTGL